MKDSKRKYNSKRIIFKVLKPTKGSTFILVLIIGLVVLFAVSTMMSFLYRDIQFTKLDENKLQALNLAEAGISNMFLNIEKLNNDEITNLPPSGYEISVNIDSGTAGYYTVNHESYSIGEDYALHGYKIVSTGTETSGIERSVQVKVLTLNIYDFIYSEQSLSSAQNIAGNTLIHGPFLVNGELDITVGDARFLAGPLLVKNNIIIGGNASIGESGTPISLFLGGSIFDINGSRIDPLNPGGENIYISNFFNSVFNIYLPTIDNNYIDNVVANYDALIVNGNLFIGDGVIEVDGIPVDESVYGPYLDFDDNNQLNIDKNIIVYGSITIGESIGVAYAINYGGSGNLIATGDIDVRSQLVPASYINFPEEDLMSIVSLQDINLLSKNAPPSPEYDNPNAALMCISGGSVFLDEGVLLRGGSVSNSLITSNNAAVYYEPGIGDFLPEGVPEFKNILFTLDWQEIAG